MYPDREQLQDAYCKQLPRLQEGELMAAGQVRSPDLEAMEAAVAASWFVKVYKKADTSQPPWKVLLQRPNAADIPVTEAHLASLAKLLGLDQLEISWEQVYEWFGRPKARGAARLPAGRQALLDHVPADPPCHPNAAEFTVPATDPRGPLRGKKGVVATGDGIKAGEVIGMYRCYCLTEEEFKQLYKRAPRRWEQKTDPSVAQPYWHLMLESYAADETDDLGGSCATKLVFSGYGYGNLTCLVNDPSLNPMETDKPELFNLRVSWVDGQGEGPNADLVTIKLLGWPYPVMVATKDIPPGQEVLYSYGAGYWDNIGPLFDHFRTRRRLWKTLLHKQQLQQDNESLRQQLSAMTALQSGGSMSLGATTVQQQQQSGGPVPSAGPASVHLQGAVAPAAGWGGEASVSMTTPAGQPTMQQQQQADSRGGGESAVSSAAAARGGPAGAGVGPGEGAGECTGLEEGEIAAAAADDEGSDNEGWKLSKQQVAAMKQRRRQQQQAALNQVLDGMAALDLNSNRRVRTQQRLLTRAGEFKVVHQHVGEVAALLLKYDMGLNIKKIGVPMPAQVRQLYGNLTNFLLAHPDIFDMSVRGTAKLTAEHRELLGEDRRQQQQSQRQQERERYHEPAPNPRRFRADPDAPTYGHQPHAGQHPQQQHQQQQPGGGRGMDSDSGEDY